MCGKFCTATPHPTNCGKGHEMTWFGALACSTSSGTWLASHEPQAQSAGSAPRRRRTYPEQLSIFV